MNLFNDLKRSLQPESCPVVPARIKLSQNGDTFIFSIWGYKLITINNHKSIVRHSNCNLLPQPLKDELSYKVSELLTSIGQTLVR